MIKIYDKENIGAEEILNRKIETYSEYEPSVRAIISEVRANGDEALYAFAEKFDKVKLNSLSVREDEIDAAFEKADKRFIEIIKEAAANITEFHTRQRREGFEIKKSGGIVLGQKFSALERVGVYVPGGTACYPSTVLMDVIPAKIAGVKEIIMTTPPAKDGNIKPEILIAARIAGVNKIFKCGGAGAIAALAYGTKSIPKVDKIVGPGNIYVALAKKEVFGAVGIDMVAGPSEILVVADDTATAKFVAADLLSQAEHDPLASAVLVTPSKDLAKEVRREIEKQLKTLPREAIARASIDNNGKIIIAQNVEKAIEIANAIAPEHLELCVAEPFEKLKLVRNAGSVFLGMNSPEALGDYFAGPNHTLPTSGSAKFSSPLSVDDFVKKTSYVYYTKEELEKVSASIATFAKTEGLQAHAKSVLARFEDKD